MSKPLHGVAVRSVDDVPAEETAVESKETLAEGDVAGQLGEGAGRVAVVVPTTAHVD